MAIYIFIGVIFLLLIGIVSWLVLKKKPATYSNAAPAAARNSGSVTQTKSGLKIEILQQATGTQEAKWGNKVKVHYTGWLTNGNKFDSSRDRGSPFEFKLGAGKVILGWDEGLKGMKIGEKRRLTIPPNLGYGNAGTAKIPPKSTLIFEIELLGIS